MKAPLGLSLRWMTEQRNVIIVMESPTRKVAGCNYRKANTWKHSRLGIKKNSWPHQVGTIWVTTLNSRYCETDKKRSITKKSLTCVDPCAIRTKYIDLKEDIQVLVSLINVSKMNLDLTNHTIRNFDAVVS